MRCVDPAQQHSTGNTFQLLLSLLLQQGYADSTAITLIWYQAGLLVKQPVLQTWLLLSSAQYAPTSLTYGPYDMVHAIVSGS